MTLQAEMAIKKTWVKRRGPYVQRKGEGRGEKAYNCNWITIKKKKRKQWISTATPDVNNIKLGIVELFLKPFQ